MENIISIANAYMNEHGGELPLLILAQKEDESRIIRCHLREKHAQSDQATFIKVMRLAMIVYGYTSYEFIVKPEFNYQKLQMTKDVWAVGHVDSNVQMSEFFVVENEKLVPYFEQMPIGGYISQILPSEMERQLQLKPTVIKQIQMYIENCTYSLPIKENTTVVENKVQNGIDTLFAIYETDNIISR